MAENDIVALKELASGGFLEVALAPADIAAAPASHTHAAADITSGVLDFDRIQQVLTAQTGSDDIDGPDIYDAAPYLVGGNLHALILAATGIEEGYLRIWLPDLATNAVGQVTVRGVDFLQDPSTLRVQITDEGNSPIFPATGAYEMDIGEEFTFRWNDGRWDMDLRPNPSATTAVSIFKPSASGTLGLSEPSDTTFRVVGSSDATKKVAFELDGLTTATTRTLTVPDASGTLALTSNTTTNLWIPASAWIPKTTAGCGVDSRETTTHDQCFDELLFDTGSDEFADALVVMPSNYNNSTVTARFYWTAASSSGGVAWGIQGRAFANDDALDTAAGTAQLVTDTLIAANDMHITSATSAVTIGGTPAANTPIQFTIYRDISDAGDDLGVDARLLGVEILFN